jgi:hypothetical protein
MTQGRQVRGRRRIEGGMDEEEVPRGSNEVMDG